MPPIRWALSSWVCKYPDEICPTTIRAKFDAVEWDLNYIPIPLSRIRRQELRRSFSEAGIKVRFHLPYSTVDVGSLDSTIRTISRDYLCLNLDLIRSLGGNYAVMHFAANHEPRVPSLEPLKDVVRYSRSIGIGIAVENLLRGPTSKPRPLGRLVREVGADVALDVGHACADVGISRLKEFLAEVAALVSHVHLYSREDRHRDHIPIESKSDAVLIASEILRSTSAKWWTCEMDTIQACIKTKKTTESAIRATKLLRQLL